MKDHKVNLLQSKVAQYNLFSRSTFRALWYRIEYQFSCIVKFNTSHVDIEDVQAVCAGEVNFHSLFYCGSVAYAGTRVTYNGSAIK